MYGRNYIEKDIGLDMYRKKCQDLHQKKLQQIKGKNKKLEIKKIDEFMTRKNDEKHRNFEFLKQEREIEVNRNNKKLLEKLVEISKGKHLSVEAFQPVNHHTMSTTSIEQVNSFRPKSLNIAVRKKESQKIEEDNYKFAKRLFESHGQISVKEMREQFKEHVKIKKHVRKLVLKKDGDHNKSKGRHGLLPPLTQQSNTVKGTTRNLQSINEGLESVANDNFKTESHQNNNDLMSPQPQMSAKPQSKASSKKQSSGTKKKIVISSNNHRSIKSLKNTSPNKHKNEDINQNPQIAQQEQQSVEKAQNDNMATNQNNKDLQDNNQDQKINIANDVIVVDSNPVANVLDQQHISDNKTQ